MAVDVQALYTQFGPLVLRRCRKLLRDEDQALDAMQDVFVLLLRNEARLDDGAPSSLLLRMATNVCLNRIRGAGRRPEDPEEETLQQIACADDAESRSLARSVLGRIFGRELESTQAIAVMHLVDGMTLEEVAREVGLSVSGVRKRLRTLKANVAALQEV
ncbi:RNA polymerase sigma factor [Vulgatibacter sp.]|uniref:RNA polymerase sigma factor n=1 Tax=Vulgatibacter sp. TaxID=1971226 RepID=UPI0035665C4D